MCSLVQARIEVLAGEVAKPRNHDLARELATMVAAVPQALAAVALVVGSISATAVLTEDQRLAAEENREAVVEVQAIEIMDASENDSAF